METANDEEDIFESLGLGQLKKTAMDLWQTYYVEIMILSGIICLFFGIQFFRVRRKFLELKRKRELQIEKNDPTAKVDKKWHDELE